MRFGRVRIFTLWAGVLASVWGTLVCNGAFAGGLLGDDSNTLGTAADDALGGDEIDAELDEGSGTSERVVLGFQAGIDLGDEQQRTRVGDVIDHAFPRDQYDVVFRQLERRDIARAVANDVLDIGLISSPPARAGLEQTLEAGALSPDGQQGPSVVVDDIGLARVAFLPVTPPAFAVVAEHSAAAESHLSRVSYHVIGIALAALVSLLLFGATVALLLNWRLPHWRMWKRQSVSMLDSRLSAPYVAWRWSISTRSGILFGAVWALSGGFLFFSWPGEDRGARAANMTKADEELRALLQEGAELAAYPRQTIQELRNGKWSRCQEAHVCLENFSRRDTMAVAGERDVLCRIASEAGINPLKFSPDLSTVPIIQTFVLANTRVQSKKARRLRARLVIGLQSAPRGASPWAACSSAEG